MSRQPLQLPQDELKRAFMRGLARTVRALDEVVLVARDTVGQASAKPKRRAKPKAKARAKSAAKPRRAAGAKSGRAARSKASSGRKRRIRAR
jgi:hypothetical protein